jgi:HK97 family phage portal protein
MRASAVWAALRLRSDLVSTMPVDAFRDVDGVRVQVKLPPVEWRNAGHAIGWGEALAATQFDLDRCGNAFGVITQKNALGLPSRIELVGFAEVGLMPPKQGETEWRYRIGADEVAAANVWHERQYVVPGLALGLSPVAYAAYSIGAYLSAQEFAVSWFGNSATPAAVLRNKERTIPPEAAAETKSRYMASVQPGSVFVTGVDWELTPLQAAANSDAYVELMQYGVPDIARFFGVPADLIDGQTPGGSITYASITQRNLQLLIMHLGPAITRRENALSSLMSTPRYIKLNRSALLAMDPEARARKMKIEIDSRTLAPSEARAIEDRAPFTESQLAEFDRLFGAARTTPTEVTK